MRRMGAAFCMALALGGCATRDKVPDLYSTIPEPRPPRGQKAAVTGSAKWAHDPASDNSGGDRPSPRFIEFFETKCSEAIGLVKPGTGKPPPYKAYADLLDANPAAARCLDMLAADVVDQCVMKSGYQDKYFGRANLIVGILQVPFAIISSGYALAGRNTLAGAVYATSAATGLSNVQKAFPSTATPSADSLVKAGQTYATVAGLSDRDLDCLRTFPHGSCSVSVLLKYSRVHDAMAAACPAASW